MEDNTTSLHSQDKYSELIEQARQVLDNCSAEEFRSLLEAQDWDYLRKAFLTMSASEGSVWIAEHHKQELVMSVNTGPDAAHLELKVRHSLNEGVMAKVFKEDSIYTDHGMVSDKYLLHKVDDELKQYTHHISACPLDVLGCRLGVLCAVQLVGAHAHAPKEWDFPKNLPEIWYLVQTGFASIVEDRTIRNVINNAGCLPPVISK